jgi:hypothetical protein
MLVRLLMKVTVPYKARLSTEIGKLEDLINERSGLGPGSTKSGFYSSKSSGKLIWIHRKGTGTGGYPWYTAGILQHKTL